uniref:Zinc finger CCCH domain-containing protein 14 n=1 Tax=Sinocyclocheilus grahami TaxID=75366 RepID=A0A672RK10_SINGR
SSAGTPLSRERAYDNEELPDYIMVMVANKKNPKQMADDLSLFLGSNTIKFTVWLHGVLEKLRSVATEPTSLHPSDPHSETSIPAENNRRAAEPRALAISSSRSDKLEGRVSSSAHENRTSRRGSSERPSRLTSAVKPLMEASAEAVIDIKPDLDDDLIAYDPMEQSLTSQALYSRSTADRPRPALESSRRTADAYRSSDVTRGQERSGSSHGRGYRSSAESSRELSRKRKAPVASSVVRVHRGHERGQESDDLNEEEDEDEEDYGIASKVSLPLKPERKPSLPPAKQANKNLILKAISEAQKSINKTTTYTVPQRQTVPVAPRTRSASDEMNNAAIRLVQEHLHALTPQDTLHNTQSIALASRLQLDLPEEDTREQLSEYREGYDLTLTSDSKVHLSCTMEVIQSHSVNVSCSHLLLFLCRERGELVEAASPKFIVTLDGVPSPLASRTDQEIEPEDEFNTTPDFPENNGPKPAVHLRLGTDFLNTVIFYKMVMVMDSTFLNLFLCSPSVCLSPADRELNEVEDMDVEPVQAKRQKLPERCRFWPACKSGDECLYHHPNTQCKFAAQCKRAGCTFYHPAVAVPPRSALKWTKTQNSE